ncbi:MAG: hypothetical protein IT340_17610, partial [Chloroflexi bacterium]|nr:hypothetical protein [Chloroflexota bacterium]
AKVATTNGQPIIVERVMYFRYSSPNVGSVTGGTATLGATATNTTWYFAEGYTGGGFDEYLTIQNPNGSADIATITYFIEGQTTPTVTTVNLLPNSRTTVTVNSASGGGVGSGKAHSTRVQTTQQTVIERPMYFLYTGPTLANIDGGHNVMGATSLIPPGTSVIMAEGFTGAGFEQYLTFQNPNPSPLDVDIQYLKADGSAPIQRQVTVPGFQRKTVSVHSTSDPAGLGPNQEFSVRVTAPSSPTNIGILAERVMYFRYNGVATGGTSAFGVLP